jgi:hypothetical protein
MTTSAFAARAVLVAKGFPVPRKHLRFPLAAEAEVTAVRNGCDSCHVLATVSKLSPCGCYLATTDPFPAGTEVRLRMHRAGESCEVPGRVIYVHKGWGMGVLFGQALPGQFRILDKWLAELERYGFLARSELFLG